MARKVVLSKTTADEIVELKAAAEVRGEADAFRRAWIAIWNSLHLRPLPPLESDDVFGEVRYRTKNEPRFSVCVACINPLAIRFAVSEEPADIAGESVTVVYLLKVSLLS